MIRISARNSVPMALLVAIALGVAGCTPPFDLNVWPSAWKRADESPWSGPTVQVLVNHINCELVRAYRAHDALRRANPQLQRTDDLWTYLATYNFVASVDLNLLVQHQENFNPSASFITPLNGDGGLIEPVVKIAKPGQPVTSTTFNNTLSIGAQLNGTQSRSMELQYLIDMSKLVQAAMSDTSNPQNADPNAQYLKFCGDDPRGALSGLQGDLRLDATVSDGLNTINTTGPFNIYSTGGPTNANDLAPSTQVATTESPTSEQFKAAGGQKKGGGGGTGGGGSPGGNATFTAKIDFVITEGANGGANWSLLEFKGPNANGTLLNLSRQTTDSLTVTFTPTCHLNGTLLLQNAAPSTVQKIHFDHATIDAIDPRTGETKKRTYTNIDIALPPLEPKATGHAPTDHAKAQQQAKPTRFIINDDESRLLTAQYGDKPGVANIKWTGYVDGDKVQLVGTIFDASGDQKIGRIKLEGKIGPNGTLTLKTDKHESQMTLEVIPSLFDQGASKDYWATVPYCDTLTAANLQAVIDNATQTNRFQRFAPLQ